MLQGCSPVGVVSEKYPPCLGSIRLYLTTLSGEYLTDARHAVFADVGLLLTHATSVWDRGVVGDDRDITPRERIRAECARRGRDAVVEDCLALLAGSTDPELTRSLVGRGGAKFFDGEEHEDTYWFRVWALRGLLWSWDARATASVVAALGDEAWRVREMAAKVVARHLVGEAMPAVAACRDDPVPRVRRAAERALVRLTEADA